MMNQTVSQTDLYVLIRKIVDGIVASHVDDLFGPDHESQPWSDVHKHLSQRIFNLIHNDFNHISALRQAEDAVFSIGETVYGELRYATSVNSIELSRRASAGYNTWLYQRRERETKAFPSIKVSHTRAREALADMKANPDLIPDCVQVIDTAYFQAKEQLEHVPSLTPEFTEANAAIEDMVRISRESRRFYRASDFYPVSQTS